jgi:ATP-dependent phosphoenolpyruvate carboxykinase
MFIQAKPEELENFDPEFVVIDCPDFHANQEIEETGSHVCREFQTV